MRTSKLHVVLAAVAVFAIACEGPDDITPPVTEFESVLSGANEIPAITSTGNATMAANINAAGDSLTYTITMGAGMATAAISAHFHAGAPNANGTVQIWLCESAASPATSPTDPAPTCAAGTAAGQLATNKIAITAAQLNSLRTYAWYTNVHSTANTTGEIRGQVRNVAP